MWRRDGGGRRTRRTRPVGSPADSAPVDDGSQRNRTRHDPTDAGTMPQAPQGPSDAERRRAARSSARSTRWPPLVAPTAWCGWVRSSPRRRSSQSERILEYRDVLGEAGTYVARGHFAGLDPAVAAESRRILGDEVLPLVTDYLVILFNDGDTYRTNAEDPAQDRRYREMRELLVEDPDLGGARPLSRLAHQGQLARGAQPPRQLVRSHVPGQLGRGAGRHATVERPGHRRAPRSPGAELATVVRPGRHAALVA